MDEYLESQCENYDEQKTLDDKKLFESIMAGLENLKDKDIFKLGKRYFTTSMYDAIMLSLSDGRVDFSQIDYQDLGQKIDELKENEDFKKYVGSASSNPTSITNKVKVAKLIMLNIAE